MHINDKLYSGLMQHKTSYYYVLALAQRYVFNLVLLYMTETNKIECLIAFCEIFSVVLNSDQLNNLLKFLTKSLDEWMLDLGFDFT